jgi:hypothetical protein
VAITWFIDTWLPPPMLAILVNSEQAAGRMAATASNA